MNMSHLRTVKLRGLGKVDLQLMKQAMAILADEYGCKLTNKIRSYGGTTRKVDIGIRGGAFQYGYGVRIDSKGHAQIIGDDYGAPISIDQFTRELTQQAYPTVALKSGFEQELGMTVTAKKKGRQVIVVGQGM